MATIEVLLPQMGESVEEGTVLRWLKKEGDAVSADEPLLEIATDKVDTEIHAPQKGVLAKILVPEGAVAKVGGVVATLSVASTKSVGSSESSGGGAATPSVSPPPTTQLKTYLKPLSRLQAARCPQTKPHAFTPPW